MFGSLMKYKIRNNVKRRLIITIQFHWLDISKFQFLNKLFYPYRFTNIKSIFSLRDNNAFLGLSDLYAKKVLQVAKIFVYPLSTNWALRRSTVLLGATLIANTYLQPTAFLLEGRETNSQVPLCSSACISIVMACRHPR
ncbi:hypothetical protein CR513_21464, partial [Mucuna pruriens]